MEMKSFYPKGNWVKRKSRIKESVESLIKWVFEKTVRKSWQSRWETNLSIARLIKSELNSVFKRFLAILTSVINYCKISQNIVLFWVQIG